MNWICCTLSFVVWMLSYATQKLSMSEVKTFWVAFCPKDTNVMQETSNSSWVLMVIFVIQLKWSSNLRFAITLRCLSDGTPSDEGFSSSDGGRQTSCGQTGTVRPGATNWLSHSLAATSFVKFFIGMGGVLNLKRKFMMNEDNPGFETIAIALYRFGNCSFTNFLVSWSGMGEGHK